MELAFLERASEFDTYGAELIVVKVNIFYVFLFIRKETLLLGLV